MSCVECVECVNRHYPVHEHGLGRPERNTIERPLLHLVVSSRVTSATNCQRCRSRARVMASNGELYVSDSTAVRDFLAPRQATKGPTNFSDTGTVDVTRTSGCQECALDNREMLTTEY